MGCGKHRSGLSSPASGGVTVEFVPTLYLHLSKNDRTDSGSRIRKFSVTVTAFMMLFRTEDWRPAMAKIGSAHR